MICKRTVPALTRCLLIALAIAVLTVEFASAEGLFPSMNQLFGTAMPSVGVALGREADETANTDSGKEETYQGFTYDDYTAFGAYLAGTGASLEDMVPTDSAINFTLSVRGASMEFSYNWVSQNATAIYPSGTRPETEKENVENKTSILPPVGGIMPSAQFAVGRKPDSEERGESGITQVWANFTDDDYNAFSTYLAQTGATMKQSNAENGVLTVEISLFSCSFTFNYDWHTKTAIVHYPVGTSPERETWNTLKGNGFILPKMDTIGKELPSMSQAISHLPDVTETLTDGSLHEIYNNFDEADYTLFSQYLQASGCAVDDYHVEDGSIMVIQLSNITGSFSFTYDTLRHIGEVIYPAGSLIETAWTAPSATSMPTVTDTVKSSQYYSESECWSIAERYFKNISWKNPSSVTIHGHSTIYDVSADAYTFYIDYSAQNGFGGYNRSYYFITVSAVTGRVTSAFGGN